jgi:flagellin
MPATISGEARIRANISAEQAYNSNVRSSQEIASSQLRISTGKRINVAADDVSAYITSKSLEARNGSLKAALRLSGEAGNVASISQDTLDNINGLLAKIKEATTLASADSIGKDEKVALAKSSYRLSQQIQSVVESSVFGGYQLFSGDYKADWVIGYDHVNNMITLGIDLQSDNEDLNVDSLNFNLNAVDEGSGLDVSNFAGVTGLDLSKLNDVTASDLNIFASDEIGSTLYSLSLAMKNVRNVASYLGGVQGRINSQEEAIRSQIVNYDSAISRLEDADVANEQLNVVKNQFLQQTSILSLAQANQNPRSYLLLF